MKRVILTAALVMALAGCSRLQTAWDVATSATVSPTAVYVAANVFDGLEVTATHYLRLPKCSPTNPIACRNQAAVVKIIPAVRSGRVARNNLETFLKQHPGQLGAQGDYDALNAAVSTLQAIFTQYNVGS